MGLRPQYSVIGVPRIPPQDSQVPVSTPGLFDALDIYIDPYGSFLFVELHGVGPSVKPRQPHNALKKAYGRFG